MKQQLILAAAVVAAMTGCTNEGFVGQWVEQTESAIAFGNANQAVTKADPTPADYAKKLGYSFVVYGWKNVSSTPSVVFDHYNIEFVDDTENSTESNLVGWEYSGIAPVNNTGKTEVRSFTPVGSQSIKYWDTNATKYDFIAFSRGKGVIGATNTTYAKFSPVDRNKIGTETPVYSATGTVEELAQVYVADLVTVNNIDKYLQSEAVTPQFRSVSAKVRVAFYETVPGYSIKSLTFYDGNTQSAGNKVVLTVDGDGSLPSGTGTMQVYIDINGKTSVKYIKSDGDDVKKMIFDSPIVLGQDAQAAEPTGNSYLGRNSNEASYTNANKDNAYMNVFPSGSSVNLKVKVGYTLVSIDGSDEEIEVAPVEAIIPAVYTDWKLNYAYTYIFKISDKTASLEPITLSAVVTETQSGVQETVTEIITPSITTYAKDVNPTANNEYIKGTNIYLSVNGATLTAASNVKLYTVTVESGACQGITEASVANCIKNGNEDHVNNTWTVTDNNGKKLVVTAATGLSVENSIAADDAPDGKAISGNFAMFTPTTAGTYAFEFTDDDNSKKYYKIIQVVAAN